nr:MerR family DNA-binding transcriptional regulator [Rhodocyclus gracilis]
MGAKDYIIRPHPDSPVSRQATFSISEIAREFNITPRTIRFYEDQGLIAPRRDGRTRVFARRDRTRLKLALRGKRLGLSLAEIKELIGMYDTARDERSQLAELLLVLGRRKAALLQQREDIEAVLGELEAFETQCRELLVGEDECADPPSAA